MQNKQNKKKIYKKNRLTIHLSQSIFVFVACRHRLLSSLSWHWTWWFAVCLVYNRDNSSSLSPSPSRSSYNMLDRLHKSLFFSPTSIETTSTKITKKKLHNNKSFVCVWTVAKNNNKLQLKQVLEVTKVLTNNFTLSTFLVTTKHKIKKM
jgi:hypothetical protein